MIRYSALAIQTLGCESEMDGSSSSVKQLERIKFTKGEKIFGICSLLAGVMLAIILLNGYSKLAVINLEINKVEKQLAEFKQDNMRYHLAKSVAGSEDNVKKFIEEKGLTNISFYSLPTKQDPDLAFESIK